MFSSESCALDSIGATFVRDVRPGEIVVVKDGQMTSITTHCSDQPGHLCVFEMVYFARPDSIIDGASVQEARQRAGAFLAQQHPVDADVVIGCPDSGLEAALGYAIESGIPYGVGFIKKPLCGPLLYQTHPGPTGRHGEDQAQRRAQHRGGQTGDYGGRFHRPGHHQRKNRQAAPGSGSYRGSRADLLPPFISECYFGTDIDSKDNLIACQKKSIEEIRKYIGADSLGYLSVEGVNTIAKGAHCKFCDGCFTGKYPAPTPKFVAKDKFEQKIGESKQLKFSQGQEGSK